MAGVLSLFGWLLSREYLLETAAVVVLLLLLPYLARALWQQWRIYRAFRNVPCDPDQHPIFGHALKFLQDMGAALDRLTDMSSKHGWKVTRLKLGPMTSRAVCVHPDTARIALRSDPKSEIMYHPFVPWLGQGLLVANGARWARSRRLLTPAFHFDILKPYLKVYAEATDTLVDLWAKVPEGESFNAFPYCSLLTLDVMLRCTCSFESNCQITKTHAPYVAAVYQLSDLIIERVLYVPYHSDWVYMLTPSYRRFVKACNTVHKFSLEVIQKRRTALEERKRRGDVLNETKRKYLDFLDVLLEARDEDGVGLTDLEIRAEVDTFMFEGHDTTASGLAWTLYNLARLPEHQEKCRQEVDTIFDQKDSIEWEDLNSLTYLKYCIKESMRLYPPVVGFGRTLAQDTEIDGHLMPKGTCVAINIFALHHHSEVWENPYDFDPLRFTPENSKDRPAHAFVPFSAGPRNCIGQEFALNEERVILAHILRKFELSLDETKPVSKDNLVILRPKPGLFLKLRHRNV